MADAQSMSVPVFAVVGRVNRGKSSIVATLAADESVLIDAAPGTTRHNREYPLRVGGRTLYSLVDTPGFERARHVLAWLRKHETGTASRRHVVEQFVRRHLGTGEFPQECELLQPVLEGAAILYIVDSSVPFSPTYEAETEILRWTGQPRMALINPIGPADHVPEWRAVLDQYFSLVRIFNAHQADFAARIELLRGLRELVDPWRAALDQAIEILIQDRARQVRESAAQIARALVELLCAHEELRLEADADPTPHREPLATRFYDRLRLRELQLRADLRRLFLHEQLRVTQPELDRADEDLFATSTWTRLGLTRGQLIASGTATGAVLGAGIDLATGGFSMIGWLIGGSLGLVSTLVAWDRLAEIRVLGAPLGGRLLRIGPVRNPNFGWIVLDRALLFYAEVSRHPHARREPVELGGREGAVKQMSAQRRQRLARIFARLPRHTDDAADREHAAAELTEVLTAVLRELET